MAASATDYFQQVGEPGTATTLSAPGYTTGGTSINVGSTTNFPSATGVTFSIDEVETVDGEEVRVAGTYNVYRGTVATGTSINNVTWVTGDGDRDYAAGSSTRVYVTTSTAWANRLVEGLSVSLDQDGTLKAGAVDNSAALASDVVTTAKIADANVTTAKLADAAVTPTKRTGGFKVGTISTANLGTTGSKAFTGIGFQPKFLRIFVSYDTSAAGAARESLGVTDGTTTVCRGSAVGGSNQARWALTGTTIVNIRNESNSTVLAATLTSIDADGFTINVGTADASYSGYYEAYA